VAPVALPTDRLTRFAWFVLAYNVAVVLFGSVVRATGSGAGCGNNWPTCRGGVVPTSGTVETVIEFTHRATSGIALILVFVLAYRVFRSRPRGDAARVAVAAAAVFVVGEALIGAALVLFEWVADDESNGRAISIALHLVNTLLLIGALTLTAWTLGGGRVPERPLPVRERRLLGLAATGLMIVGAAGAITALGDTLFPSESLLEGIRNDFTGTFIVRLRWIHPIVAVVTGFYLLWLRNLFEAGDRRIGGVLATLVVVQLALGVLNVLLLAPVWMQVVHLLVADAIWIAFVLYSVDVLNVRRTLKAPS
jgi:heme A synthase